MVKSMMKHSEPALKSEPVIRLYMEDVIRVQQWNGGEWADVEYDIIWPDEEWEPTEAMLNQGALA